VAEVIQKSSNVGTAKMALGFSPKEMWEMFDSVGFGQAPNLGFPGEVNGRLRPWKNWRRSSRPPCPTVTALPSA
jgi:cell division protein FtsI (penicillin-binding protein 3)